MFEADSLNSRLCVLVHKSVNRGEKKSLKQNKNCVEQKKRGTVFSCNFKSSNYITK